MTKVFRDRAIALGVILLVGWWGQCNANRNGKLEGEIKARGESIQQLGKLAAAKQKTFAVAKAAYIKKPTAEGCSAVLLTCEQRDSVRVDQIGALDKQVGLLKKLKGRQKIFGIIPRPVIGPGGCISSRFKPELCVAVIIPLN